MLRRTTWDTLIEELEALDRGTRPSANLSEPTRKWIAAYGLQFALLECKYQRAVHEAPLD